jgi:KDO2-lipid IV(A) lauroyltransferase
VILYRLISWLPFPLLYTLAWLAYLVLYYVTGYRKAVVRQNLGRAFPEKSEAEITALARTFYRRLAQVALEIVKARRMRREQFLERVRLVNPEKLREASDGLRQSVIVLTIHQGNWEWMLHGVKLHLDIPIDPVYKPLHNSGLNQLMLEIRSQFGSRPIPIASAARDILRRRREFRLFVLVADQAPIEGERSYWTRFMNRQAAFHEGGEAIAKMTGYPVLFARCRRRSRGYYEVEFSEVARPPYDDSEHRIVENYVRLAERAIRAEPESWLWSNRRWKRRPPQEEPDHPA